MHHFDVEAKAWKPLLTLAPVPEVTYCNCAEVVGSKVFVAGSISPSIFCLYCYDLERNVWEKHGHSGGQIVSLCLVGDYMYALSSNYHQVPQRYSFAEHQWQTFAKVSLTTGVYFFNSGETVLQTKVFVLYGKGVLNSSSWPVQNAVLYCFDPVRNAWEEKASTCCPHFGSSLFSVNKRLYVAGGKDRIDIGGQLDGNPASVEVYDDENNKWSVVEQKHIPPNKLGAVEIEGRVYFIINKFPIDSGIRIPPGEVYPISLGVWVNLGTISHTAALCYMPVRKESLKVE